MPASLPQAKHGEKHANMDESALSYYRHTFLHGFSSFFPSFLAPTPLPSLLFPSLPFPYLGAPRIRGIHLLLPTPYRTTASTLHLYLAHPTPPHLHLTSYSSFKCLKAAMRCVVELLEAPAPILLTALRCLQKKKDVYAVIFKSPAQTLLEDRGRVEKCLG